MTREQRIAEIYSKEANKDSCLAKACKEFLDFQKRYYAGEGDVIVGLKHLDRLEEKVKEPE